jgi:hypothetical protein
LRQGLAFAQADQELAVVQVHAPMPSSSCVFTWLHWDSGALLLGLLVACSNLSAVESQVLFLPWF